eukprot:Skav219289  [mRNA]  locus=scaffold2157:194637:194816:- [translate_table: standard]
MNRWWRQICAVVGGIFTVAGLVDSVPQLVESACFTAPWAPSPQVLHKSIVHLAKKARRC